MIAIKLTITAFVAVLLLIVGAGWQWTARHQPPEKAIASHMVLGIAAAAGIVGLVAIWRPRQARHGRSQAPTRGGHDVRG
jgi:hypothetical protein